jgi:hypothetical protein
MFEVPLSERINAGTLIVEGKVKKSVSFWDKVHKNIYTSHTIEVYKVFKGQGIHEVTIVTEGGTVSMDKEVASSALELEAGDVGIFICEDINPGRASNLGFDSTKEFSVVAGQQGFFKYDLHSFSASDVFNRYENIYENLHATLQKIIGHPFQTTQTFDPDVFPSKNINEKQSGSGLISYLSPKNVPSGTKDRLTIYGNGFGVGRDSGRVGFKNSDDGGRTTIYPDASQYLLWQDNKIIVELPDNAGTGPVLVLTNSNGQDMSQDTLRVPYARTTLTYKEEVERPQLVNKESNGGYVWQMNTEFNANPDMKMAFLNSIITWRCNTLVNWSVGDSITIAKKGNDNINIATLDTYDKLQKGVLGVCYSYYSSCPDDGIWYVSGYDIVFRDTSTWHFGTGPISSWQYDMESVMLHELGHGHQLGHVINKKDVMHYALKAGTIKRNLSGSNLACANLVLSQSTSSGACKYPPMQLLTTAICTDPTKDFYTFKEININPNPFVDQAFGIYNLEAETNVSIDVYSMLGQKVANLIEEVRPAGKHVQIIDAAQLGLIKGMYMVRLTVGKNEYSKKLISLF